MSFEVPDGLLVAGDETGAGSIGIEDMTIRCNLYVVAVFPGVERMAPLDRACRFVQDRYLFPAAAGNK